MRYRIGQTRKSGRQVGYDYVRAIYRNVRPLGKPLSSLPEKTTMGRYAHLKKEGEVD